MFLKLCLDRAEPGVESSVAFAPRLEMPVNLCESSVNLFESSVNLFESSLDLGESRVHLPFKSLEDFFHRVAPDGGTTTLPSSAGHCAGGRHFYVPTVRSAFAIHQHGAGHGWRQRPAIGGEGGLAAFEARQHGAPGHFGLGERFQ